MNEWASQSEEVIFNFSSTCHTAYFFPTVRHSARDFYLNVKADALLQGWYAHIRQYYGVVSK
jgi:hypothetical protein